MTDVGELLASSAVSALAEQVADLVAMAEELADGDELDAALAAFAAARSGFLVVGDVALRARCELGEATVLQRLGRHGEAIGLLHRARAAFVARRDRFHAAETADRLGVALAASGSPSEAVDHHRLAINEFSALDEHACVAQSARSLGESLVVAGRMAEACDAFDRAEQLFVSVDDAGGAAWAAFRLGEVLAQESRIDAADAALRRALAVARTHAWLPAAGECTGMLGCLAQRRGDHEEAAQAFERANELSGEHDWDPELVASYLALGRDADAAAVLRGLAARAADPTELADHEVRLAVVVARLQRVDEAVGLLRSAGERYGAVGRERERAHAETTLAEICAAAGVHRESAAAYLRARALHRDAGREEAARCGLLAAVELGHVGAHGEALSLLGAVVADGGGDEELAAEVEHAIGRTLAALGRREEAVARLRAARTVLARLNSRALTDCDTTLAELAA